MNKIDKAIRNCELNIKKIERYNETVGTMYMISTLGYEAVKKALENIKKKKKKKELVPKIKNRNEVMFYSYDWLSDDDDE